MYAGACLMELCSQVVFCSLLVGQGLRVSKAVHMCSSVNLAPKDEGSDYVLQGCTVELILPLGVTLYQALSTHHPLSTVETLMSANFPRRVFEGSPWTWLTQR